MATFQVRVEGLTSLSIGTTPTLGELTEFLKDGVNDVTNRWLSVKPQDIEGFQRESSIIDSNSGLYVGGAKIISVIREAGADGSSDGSTAWESCRKIPASMQSKVVDTESLHFSSKYNPVYLIDDNGRVNVYPVASSNNGYKVFYVNNIPTDETNSASLTYAHSDIKYFPDDKVYLVIMYAGIRSLQANLGAMGISTFSLSASAPASVPSAPSITGVSVGAVTIASLPSAPNYTTPTQTISSVNWATEYPSQASAITTALAKILASVENAEDEIEDGNKMTANIVLGVAEIAESVGDTDVASSEIKTAADGIASALGKFRADGADPALFGDETQYLTGVGLAHVKDALEIARDVIDTGFVTDEDSGSGDDATPKSVGFWLDDEDPEMVQATLQTAQTEIQRAQAHIAEWNAAVQTLQVEISGFASEMQARGAWTSAKAQVWNGYFASAGAYAQAAQTYLASAQGYSAEIQTRLSATPIKIQEYQARVQDALNVFNEGNAVYQAAVQRNIQQAQIDMQDAQKEADIDLQEKIQDYTLELQRVSTDQQKYQALVNAEIQTYQQEVAEKSTEYQWMTTRLKDLKEEYDRAFLIAAPKQQQQQARA